jgi:hypothetical protein
MTSPATTSGARPNLDAHDFETVRQIYSEAQQWTRHYESLIVNANVLLITASLIFVGVAFDDGVTTVQSTVMLVIPILMSAVGLALTQTLFRLYADCIERMIRMEHLLNCYDPNRFSAGDGQGSLLYADMGRIPVRRPASVMFFIWFYVLLTGAYGALLLVRFS